MELIRSYLGYNYSYLYDYVSDGMSLADWRRLINAAEVAKESPHRFAIGAVVHKGRKPLVNAVNVRKTSPHVYPLRESIHAEICALNKLDDVEGATVYVARLSKNQKLLPARPCLYCVVEMFNRGVSRVVFTLDDTSADSFHLNMVTSKLIVN